MLASWTNAASEHQVEFDRLADFVIRVWIANVMCPHELAELWAAVVVQLIRKISTAISP